MQLNSTCLIAHQNFVQLKNLRSSELTITSCLVGSNYQFVVKQHYLQELLLFPTNFCYIALPNQYGVWRVQVLFVFKCFT
ncbi:hypothetical protein MXB_996 [Myxobolus squamalis]|nr:hypothetical protein MXB_996 [Myxobolus squamalis]